MTLAVQQLSREALGVPEEKTRYEIQRDLVIQKVNTLLLPLMRQHGIDMWITLRDFRATRTPEETAVYRRLVEWTALWEEVGLSRAAITPGVTTPDEVHWWWREQAKAVGLDIASFLPGLRI